MNIKTFKLLVAALCIAANLFAQTTRDTGPETALPHEHTDWCGFTPPGNSHQLNATRGSGPGSGPVLATLPTTLPTGSTLICGKFRAIFMDVVNGSGFGFDDPVLGTARKNCVCDVFNYIQLVIAVPANIGTTDPYVDIIFNPSTNNIASPALATASLALPPAFYANTPGHYQGYAYDYITTGIKPDPLSEDGTITFNFAHPFEYCTPTLGSCNYDFYSVTLHEMTHILGFASFIRENSTNTSLESAVAPSVFSEFDKRCLGYWNGLTFDKLVDITTYAANGGINTAIPANPFSGAPANRIWLYYDNSMDLNTSRLNQPIYSKTGGFVPGTSLSHFDIAFWFGVKRCNQSPGFVPNYVMAASAYTGRTKRMYTPQELRWLQHMGYTMNPSYIYNNFLPNRPPRTLGAVIGSTYDACTLNPPAFNNNLYIATTTCQPVTINVGANTISTALTSHTLGLDDPDGDPISVYNGQLMNLRGCGDGENTHSLLTINPSNNIITFTPRPDFIGRAQFAFHLYDGKERGSYIVVSIDVAADGCTMNTSGEYVMNGTFEEGEELCTFDDPLKTIVDQTDVAYHYNFNRFADGVQFIEAIWQDIARENSYDPCLYGMGWYSYPLPGYAPVGSPTGAKRYVMFDNIEEFNMTLIPAITPSCGPYTLSMEVLSPQTIPIGTVFPVTVSFTNSFEGTVFFNPVTINVTNTGNWQTVSTTFNYSGAPMSYIHLSHGGPANEYMFMDNISIKKSTNALVVAPAATPAAACVGNSVLHTANASGGTAPYTYNWSPGGITTSSFTTTYSTPGMNNYTLVVTDANGCTANGSLAVNVQPNLTISPVPPLSVCENSASFTCTGSPAGGTWSGPGISSGGLFNPATAGAGVHVLTYSYPGYCPKSHTIEVFSATNTWPKHPLGSSKEEFRAIVKTTGGDVIAAGLFIKDVSVSGYPNWNVTTGNGQLMVVRYNDNCVPVWAVNLGNVSGNENVSDMEIDGSGNVFISGTISTTTTFGAYTLTGPAAYVLKLNGTTGAVMAAYASSSNSSASGAYLAIDAGGSVYLEGVFNGSLQFGSLTAVTSVSSLNDIYLARFTNALAPVWLKSFGSPAADYAGGLATNSGSVLFAAANIGQTFTIGVNTYTNTTTNTTDIFIGRFNLSNGAFLTGRMEGNSTNNCLVQDIQLDGSSNVYFTGGFQGSLAVAATALSASSGDIFIGRWTSALANSWAYSMGGTSNDQGSRIALDGAGNVYFTGTYVGTATFTGFTPASLTGSFNVFVVKLTTGGTKSYATQSSTTSGTIAASGLTVFSSGLAYLAGHFTGVTAFGSTPAITATVTDGFVARINAAGSFYLAPHTPDVRSAASDTAAAGHAAIRIYPNPTGGVFQVEVEASYPSRIYITDISGRVLDVTSNAVSGNRLEFDLTGYSNGLYFVVIENNGQRTTEKVMVNR